MSTNPPPTADQNAIAAAAMLRNELGRVDTKAALLLALAGAVLAGIGSSVLQTDLPTAALAVGAVGSASLLAAVFLLLLAVLPALSTPSGWPCWHDLTDEELRTYLVTGADLAEVRALQAAARQKFVRVRQAIQLIRAGFGVLVVALVLVVLL